MKTKYIVYALLVILFGAFVAYRIKANSQKGDAGGRGGGAGRGAGGPGGGPGGPGGPPVPVNGVIVTPKSFSNSLSVTGSIEANEQIEIRSEVSGLIKGIYFREGSNVRRGQTLLKINDIELQAQLSQALTREKLASETELRANMLLKKEAISKEEYDIALADKRSLQAATRLIRAQISRTVVVAPFSGRIGLKTVSVGGYITPATVVASLSSTDPVKIIFSVPEKYAQQIRTGSDIHFTVSGSERRNTATVYAIDPGINETSRTLKIAARAANPGGLLLPGSFTKVDLPLAQITNAILIPSEAVVPVERGKKVFVSKNGKATEVLIETSTRTEKEVLVISGLSAGDTLLTTGIMALKPDSPVKVKITKN
ncbi:efflux RND transporter periplasmic adaptor subunit [Daejeonella lutea]|uniref:Membrane fusion protein, multidrug efflux system n=1 Tax=Daejeonella lutea TaxID=572036 RepID=A0A1T5EFX6_9SPHI|nr:efflux RND transporter periplasmic adaptor subunit [Daejeonella lutea]SKB82675.1 membrane fusion protein, multidrug efflux system [Daejeonella lutea]